MPRIDGALEAGGDPFFWDLEQVLWRRLRSQPGVTRERVSALFNRMEEAMFNGCGYPSQEGRQWALQHHAKNLHAQFRVVVEGWPSQDLVEYMAEANVT